METDSPSKKARTILDDLRSIINEQEQTINQQQSQIECLQSEKKAMLEKIEKLEKTIAEDSSNHKKHRRKSSSSKKLRTSSTTLQPNGVPENIEEIMPSKRDRSGSESVERSSSFQRKHLEEHDASSLHRSGTYELSSDIRDRQVEAIRNFYGGAAKCEHAARVIQEAYRNYRMKNQFKKIRRSRTRRLTLEAVSINVPKKAKVGPIPNRSKSLDQATAAKIALEISQDNSTAAQENGIDSNSIDNMENETGHNEVSQSEDSCEKTPVKGESDPENTDDEAKTPKVLSPVHKDDIRGLSQEELVNRILAEASPVTLNYVRRKKKHGYETVILGDPNDGINTEPRVIVTDPSVKLRHPTGSVSSQTRNSDSEIGSRRESPAWLSTNSEISLTGSYDNELDNESVRSSDTASITSDMSSLIGDGLASSYLRRSTISVRSSMNIDVNNDAYRKRLYRIGLNLFNKKPSKGLTFLIENKFVANTAPAVATFLLNRKGLSRQMVGEYLGNVQKVFNQEVLDSVCELMEFSGLELDEALRSFQSQIKVQGEAQKVERLVEAFSQRYCTCNPKMIEGLQNPDSIFVLAFAIIMLNTDLHSPNMKHERRMTEVDFVKNLRGVDNGDDLSEESLKNIYNRIKTDELTTMDDHMTQVLQVENSIVGKKPVLAVPHRRLVCFCRMYQVTDPSKPQKHGLHQREVFLFNDMMLVTKILQKKKVGTTYTYKQTISLHGLSYLIFEGGHFPHGIRLINSLDNRVLINFNAPNEHDRKKFVNDVRECIAEVQQMESLRIGAELEKATSPTDLRTKHYLTLDTKKMSSSMQNLNENSYLSITRPDGHRPTSMYDIATTNENNNNFNSPVRGSLNKPHRNGARFPGIGTLFGHSAGKRSGLRGKSKLSGSMSSLATNGSTPSVSYSYHEGHEV